MIGKKLIKRWQIKEFQGFPYQVRSNEYYSHIIKDYWLANPDQRVGQVCINLGVFLDNLRIWSDEEWEILQDQGLEP